MDTVITLNPSICPYCGLRGHIRFSFPDHNEYVCDGYTDERGCGHAWKSYHEKSETLGTLHSIPYRPLRKGIIPFGWTGEVIKEKKLPPVKTNAVEKTPNLPEHLIPKHKAMMRMYNESKQLVWFISREDLPPVVKETLQQRRETLNYQVNEIKNILEQEIGEIQITISRKKHHRLKELLKNDESYLARSIREILDSAKFTFINKYNLPDDLN